ncbi:MAG: hypothetical protein QHH07_10185 [Sedimentisphaerales bacterium]|jgi:ribonuclease HII|nr:hypothetical protein [Sedimentisphaerales bacterium]
MALLIGIDEAGYGPLLGPLVISAVAISLPEGSLAADLWQLFRRSIVRAGRPGHGRLVVDDSKLVYKRRAGIKCLERSVLAAIAASGHSPRHLLDLVTLLDPASLPRLAAYPWHASMGERKLPSDDPDILLASKTLARDLSAKNAALVAIRSRCIDVAYYNELVDRLRNKATLLFCMTCQLIKDALDLTDEQEVLCLVDRQGGRLRYRDRIQTMFPDCSMTVLNEDGQLSSYLLSWPHRNVRVQFAVGADGADLPVALASMVSKYLREQLIDQMNLYFANLCPGLRRTSGYWQDGHRFLEELSRWPNLRIESRLLVRSR